MPGTEAANTPAPTPGSNYDYGDTSFDPALDTVLEPGPSGAESSQRPGADTSPRHAASPGGTPQTAPAPSVPAHSPRTLALAQDLGYSAEEIAGMKPDELDSAVHHAARQLARGRKAEPAPAATPAAAAKPAEVKPAEVKPEDDPFKEFEDTVHEDVLKALRKAVGIAGKTELDKLQAKIGELEGREQQRAQAAAYDEIDAVFKGMGALSALIGTGGRKDVAPGTPEMQQRVLLIQAAERDTGSGTLAEKLARAGAALIEKLGIAKPAEPAKPTEKPTPAKPVPPKDPATGQFTKRPTAEEWREGGLNAPTGPQDDEKPGESKAVKTAARWMREHFGADDAEAADLFPGASANGK